MLLILNHIVILLGLHASYRGLAALNVIDVLPSGQLHPRRPHDHHKLRLGLSSTEPLITLLVLCLLVLSRLHTCVEKVYGLPLVGLTHRRPVLYPV
jgi:hypothetical protein